MSNKQRIITLLNYLKENTNAFHRKKTEDIIAELEKSGFDVERKTIYNDVRQLNDLGYAVEKAHDGYYFDGEIFELAELRVLIDSIKSSTFLSEKKSESMIRKLLSQTNCYDRELLSDFSLSGNKTTNEKILYNIDAIMRAISRKQVIKFKMFDLSVDGEKKYRPRQYNVYPRRLVVHNERYYLVGTPIQHNTISNFRIDRIEDVADSSKTYVNDILDIDVQKYLNEQFNMFSGTSENITLRVDNGTYDEVIKQFGNDVLIQEKGKKEFVCNAYAAIAPTFFGWLFMMGDKVKLIGPEHVKQQFIELCSQRISQASRKD